LKLTLKRILKNTRGGLSPAAVPSSTLSAYPVTPAVSYLLTGLAGYSVGREE